MSEKQKVATEVAEAEFRRWAEAIDLDIDEKKMSQEDRKGFERQKRPVMRALERGQLIINPDGSAQFQPKADGLNPIVFREPMGKAMMSPRNEGISDIANQAVIVSSWTGEPIMRIEALPWVDLAVCNALVNLAFSFR